MELRQGFVLRFLASGVLLGLVLWKVPVGEIAESVRSFSPLWAAPILALHFLGVLIRSAKLRYISAAAGVPIDFGSIVRIHFIGNLAYTIVPSLEVAQIGLLGHEKRAYGRAALSVSIDRLSGVVALLMIGVAALALRPELLGSLHPATPVLIATLLFISLTALCAGFSDRVRSGLWRLVPGTLRAGSGRIARGLRSLHDGSALLGERKSRIAVLLGIALVFQLTGLGIYHLVCRGLGLPVAPSDLAAVYPLMALANLLPSLLGIGVRDAGFVLVLQQIRIQPADAVALSLFHLALILYSAAIGAFLLALRGSRSPSGSVPR